MRRVLAAIAAVALGALDYLVVSAAFLDVPKLGEGLLALVAAGAVAAWLARNPLPLFVTQTLLLIAAAWHAIEAGSPLDARAAVTLATSFVVANGLAWFVGGALPTRSG